MLREKIMHRTGEGNFNGHGAEEGARKAQTMEADGKWRPGDA
jgi:hypothetical protein